MFIFEGSFSGNATFARTFGYITSITTEDMFMKLATIIMETLLVARHERDRDMGTNHKGGSCIVTGTYNGNITFGSIPTLTGYGQRYFYRKIGCYNRYMVKEKNSQQ